MKFLGNGVVFCALYIVFLIPTYVLPYFGSNSTLIAGTAAGSDIGVLPQTVLHLAALFALVLITWFRSLLVAKQWLVILPILAAIFDMTPGLSSIPLAPTVLHLFAIIKGVSESPVGAAQGSTQPGPSNKPPV